MCWKKLKGSIEPNELIHCMFVTMSKQCVWSTVNIKMLIPTASNLGIIFVLQVLIFTFEEKSNTHGSSDALFVNLPGNRYRNVQLQNRSFLKGIHALLNSWDSPETLRETDFVAEWSKMHEDPWRHVESVWQSEACPGKARVRQQRKYVILKGVTEFSERRRGAAAFEWKDLRAAFPGRLNQSHALSSYAGR